MPPPPRHQHQRDTPSWNPGGPDRAGQGRLSRVARPYQRAAALLVSVRRPVVAYDNKTQDAIAAGLAIRASQASSLAVKELGDHLATPNGHRREPRERRERYWSAGERDRWKNLAAAAANMTSVRGRSVASEGMWPDQSVAARLLLRRSQGRSPAR